MLFTGAMGAWAQNTNPTQIVCPGTQPYYVVPGDVNSSFLWTITPGISGTDWTIIPGADAYHISVIWANPTVQTIFILSITETTPGPNSCSITQSVQVTVNPLPIATISYPGTPYCATGTATVTQTGQTGGTYSSTAGLVIDGVTGTIDLVASTAGTYTVTYSFGNGTCTNTTTTTVTINALPVVTIDPAGPLCINSGVYLLIGNPVGGVFSGTGVTGNQFDPAAAGLGTHTITYTYSNGTCSNSVTTTITVTPAPTTSLIWHN